MTQTNRFEIEETIREIEAIKEYDIPEVYQDEAKALIMLKVEDVNRKIIQYNANIPKTLQFPTL